MGEPESDCATYSPVCLMRQEGKVEACAIYGAVHLRRGRMAGVKASTVYAPVDLFYEALVLWRKVVCGFCMAESYCRGESQFYCTGLSPLKSMDPVLHGSSFS
ncbi:hypothetical protein JZ751_027760, partial [Albula glossodonta]